jgi:hypothetical protein
VERLASKEGFRNYASTFVRGGIEASPCPWVGREADGLGLNALFYGELGVAMRPNQYSSEKRRKELEKKKKKEEKKLRHAEMKNKEREPGEGEGADGEGEGADGEVSGDSGEEPVD